MAPQGGGGRVPRGAWKRMQRLKQYVERLVHSDNRLLRPFQRQLRNPSLWRFNQRSVARGIAIGFFFGILTPVAQTVFAIVAAIGLRANVVVAAGSTLITNPFTFPLFYYSAYRLGLFVTGRTSGLPSQAAVEHAPDVEISTEAAERALDVVGWWPTLVDWLSTVGPPLIAGVVVLALCVSLAGYLVSIVVWAVAARTARLVRPTESAPPPRIVKRRETHP